MKAAERSGVIGFILTPEETDKLRIVANYMGVSPHQLVANSIERLYLAWEEQQDAGSS